jgi:hypothetical protein
MDLKQIDDICDEVKGYVDGFDRVMQNHDISDEDLRELLLDNSVEECPCCGWFVDSYELVNDEGIIDSFCDNCRD